MHWKKFGLFQTKCYFITKHFILGYFVNLTLNHKKPKIYIHKCKRTIMGNMAFNTMELVQVLHLLCKLTKRTGHTTTG